MRWEVYHECRVGIYLKEGYVLRVKAKAKLSLDFTKYRAMKTYGGVEV
jgi:hypothetical protein